MFYNGRVYDKKGPALMGAIQIMTTHNIWKEKVLAIHVVSKRSLTIKWWNMFNRLFTIFCVSHI
jgi:hypothetical protein